MEIDGKQLLICNCEGTMPLDGRKLGKACKAVGIAGDVEINSQLCRAQVANFETALGKGKPVMVACTQEAPLFNEIASERAFEGEISYFNIRELAGWSAQAERAAPKIAALAAAAAVDPKPTPGVAFASEGICLVYGHDERALEAADKLASRLDVTVLLTGDVEVIPPRTMHFPIFRGRITQARGHLGKFSINLDGYAAADPSSRMQLQYGPPKSNVFTECDLILDLTGGTPLFTGHERRDGYHRPDPDNPSAVLEAILELSESVGEFEKPRYVRYDAGICAHGRSRKTGCTRCLDVCPAGAIKSLGDIVEIDGHVCAGCGMCASVCPTGAATYQLPAGDSLFMRLRALLTAYDKAEGRDAVLLLHDERYGGELLSLMSRAGPGLPANVLPLAINEITQVGIDFLTSALAFGAEQIAILVGPEKSGELEGLASQIGLVETVMEGLGYGAGRVTLLDQVDPDAVAEALNDLPRMKKAPAGSFLPIGGKRSRTGLALAHLHAKAPAPVDILPLPKGAPFGTVQVDTSGCTLCLACVGACPTGALSDDPDRPLLAFNEEACVQCGLCKNTCPEQVIALEPRFNFTTEAKNTRVLNEAEPFHCLRCGKPFGVAQSVERIADQLADKHPMFMGGPAVERIMMCEDCRVVVQFDAAQPLASGVRPRIRTTDEDLRNRALGIADEEDT
ncbi:4Fe-4S binding protein [Limibacillus halophilus]|uniref:Ferredoxin n=1 Tax=Limibacillus halophilus TaxID=1579333 RepID=A0A839STV1_9PROT|nr:4Fe-4S binding protein [Limibacillus halophilus]MBB3065140.1 ferredoxin [Limibacillus halophilus]